MILNRDSDLKHLKALEAAYIETAGRRRNLLDRKAALLDKARDADAKAAKLRSQADALRARIATEMGADLDILDQADAIESRARQAEATASSLRKSAAELDIVAHEARGYEAMAYLGALIEHRREKLLGHLLKDKTARSLLLDWLAAIRAAGWRELRQDGHMDLPIPLASALGTAEKQGLALRQSLEDAVERARRGDKS